jgi:hypothetical protein
LVLSKELNTLTKDMQKLTKRKSELCWLLMKSNNY